MRPRLFRSWRFLLLLWLGIGAIVLLTPSTARADDCTRDPLNAADCMRTPGFRQGITVILGAAATTGVILTNTIGQILTSTPTGVTPTTPPAQPPARTPLPSAEPPPAKEPVPPKPPTGTEPPEEGAPPGPGQKPGESSWINFDNIKRLIDYPNKIFGVYTKYTLDPQALRNLKNALDVWRRTPSKEAAENLIQAVRNRMDPGGRMGGWLDKGGKAMDAIDAIFKAQKVIADRGYTGWEKAGAYYVEGVNKVLVTMLTKNPVVSIVDQVAGDLTGVNIENTIRGAEQKWHDVTKEYANNIYNVDALDAEIQGKDQALRYIRKMKQMIADGKISREEGVRRARRIYDMVLR